MAKKSHRILLRGFSLADAAVIEESGFELFVAVERPPPVRAIVEARANGSARRLVVSRVLETPDDSGRRGFFAREVERSPEDLLAIGSEGLPAGEPGAVASLSREDSGPDSAARYPVPAPVLDPEPSQPIDLREAEGDSPDEDPDPQGPHDPAAGRGKKRKGRRRG